MRPNRGRIFVVVLALALFIPTSAQEQPPGGGTPDVGAQIKALQEQINAEVAAREAADSALEQAINAEESARIGADSILRANIDAEESARIAANTDLADRIKVLEESRK